LSYNYSSIEGGIMQKSKIAGVIGILIAALITGSILYLIGTSPVDSSVIMEMLP